VWVSLQPGKFQATKQLDGVVADADSRMPPKVDAAVVVGSFWQGGPGDGDGETGLLNAAPIVGKKQIWDIMHSLQL
jgi:hypothetical protein